MLVQFQGSSVSPLSEITLHNNIRITQIAASRKRVFEMKYRIEKVVR